MKLLKNLFSITVIALLLLLCSCDGDENCMNVKISPSEKSLFDLATKIYEDSQLLELVKFSGKINELNNQYPIECLRNINGVYRASYLGDGSVAVLLFDDSGNRLSGNIYSTQLLTSDFDGLAKGQLLSEVRAIDPNGEYLFLYTGRNDTPKVSSHYTKDGHLITIAYDASNVIISINEELI